MASYGEVVEGFICPICMTDLNSPAQLTKHFEEFHNNDPEILKSLKDLFGKAKKKILKQDEIQNASMVLCPTQKKLLNISWKNQELGIIKSHTSYFREIRNARLERYASETNKLLIRLDKLLYNLPTDPIDRKTHERSVVQWVEDKDVNLCPNCARSFHVARRKHHCRLCGAVMCQSCTVFLSLTDARKMTSPASIQDDLVLSPRTQEPQFTDRIVQSSMELTKLVRSPSSGSLNSILSRISDSTNTDQHFRLCQHCNNLLDAREKLKARHFEKPIVHQIYEKLRSQLEEAKRYIEMYNKMWQSLSEGETIYDLRDTQLLRVKIARIGDQIDTVSKTIVALSPPDDNEITPKPETRLYNMVRVSVKIFLKEYLSNVPAVPSEEEYSALQELRQKRIEARIAHDKQMEMEARKERHKNMQKKDNWNPQSAPLSNSVVLDRSQGWGPSSPNVMLASSMDPIIEQMGNLRAYIKQAKADCRFDEAATLEENLKELQSAYFAMQNNGSNES